jgi:excisionase family DNA binding protein
MERNNNLENWVTLKEIQVYLGIGRETVLQWISKRKMPAYKVGKLWKFKISEIDDWVRSGGADERNYTSRIDNMPEINDNT